MKLSFTKEEVKELIMKNARQVNGEQILREMTTPNIMERYINHFIKQEYDAILDETFNLGKYQGYMEAKLEIIKTLSEFFKIDISEK